MTVSENTLENPPQKADVGLHSRKVVVILTFRLSLIFDNLVNEASHQGVAAIPAVVDTGISMRASRLLRSADRSHASYSRDRVHPQPTWREAMKVTDARLARARKLAADNYETWGQYIVECFSDDELREDIESCSSTRGWVSYRKHVAARHEENDRIADNLWSY